jgi:hypothetical protein
MSNAVLGQIGVLNRIVGQSCHVLAGQRREFSDLRQRTELIQNKAVERKADVEEHKKSARLYEVELRNGAEKYAVTMDNLRKLALELHWELDKMDAYEKRNRQFAYLQLVCGRYSRLLQRSREEASLNEWSQLSPVNLHRWNEIKAGDEDLWKHLRYHMRLLSKLNEADVELAQLCRERDSLKKAIQLHKREFDGALPVKSVRKYIARYAEDLLKKEKEIQEIKNAAELNRSAARKSSVNCRGVFVKVVKEKHNLSIAKAAVAEAAGPFMTQQRVIEISSIGGGFRPRPPAVERVRRSEGWPNVPAKREALDIYDRSSQRSHRPNAAAMRKQLSRPETPRRRSRNP